MLCCCKLCLAVDNTTKQSLLLLIDATSRHCHSARALAARGPRLRLSPKPGPASIPQPSSTSFCTLPATTTCPPSPARIACTAPPARARPHTGMLPRLIRLATGRLVRRGGEGGRGGSGGRRHRLLGRWRPGVRRGGMGAGGREREHAPAPVAHGPAGRRMGLVLTWWRPGVRCGVLGEEGMRRR